MSDLDPVSGRPYASTGRRVGAYVADAAAVLLLSAGALLLLRLGVGEESSVLLGVGLVLAILALGYALAVILGIGRKGHSPAKKALGLRVGDSNTGEPIGVLRAIGRQLTLGILGPLNLFQLFLIHNQERRQGWHDKVAKSVVTATAGAPTGPVPLGPAAPGAAQPPLTMAPPPPTGPMASPPPASGMIAPPPVVAPSSAAAPPPAPSPTTDVADTVTSPSKPGASPTLPPAPRPAPTMPVRPEQSEEVSPHTELRAVGSTPTRHPDGSRAWVLRTPGGLEQSLSGSLLAGRDPDLGLVPGALAWRIVDPQLSVSKTHALFGVTGGSAWVEDWVSTNGVMLRRGGIETDLVPHDRTTLVDGDEVVLGDFVVLVLHQP